MLRDEAMNEILIGSPLLESLTLIEFEGLNMLNVTNPCLKKLVVTHGRRRPMRISCPKVELLKLSGWIDEVDLVNVSPVVDASLLFRCYYILHQRNYDTILALFTTLSHSRALKLCCWCIWLLMEHLVLETPFPFFSWKCLTLEGVCWNKWYLPGVASLLRKSMVLETLTLDNVHENDIFFMKFQNGSTRTKLPDGEGCADDYWDSLEEEFVCLRYSLKYVKLVGSFTGVHNIKFLEFLLKKAMVLEKLTIVAKAKKDQPRLTSEKLLLISQKLLSVPRASPKSAVEFTWDVLK